MKSSDGYIFLLIIVIFEYDVSKRRYNSMKSLNSSYIHTEYTTPKI